MDHQQQWADDVLLAEARKMNAAIWIATLAHCFKYSTERTLTMPKVLFYPGDGTEYLLPVKYIAQFAYGPNGVCAFCNGDPLGEESEPDTPISIYMRNPYAEFCPFCLGRPS